MTDLKDLKAKALAAKRGHWTCTRTEAGNMIGPNIGYVAANWNGDYIAAASPDVVLGLIERIERMTRVNEIYKSALEDCTGGDLASGEGIYKAERAREALKVGDGE